MSRKERGFTLIEILVVISIIASLMGVVFLLFGPAKKVQMDTITTQRMNKIATGLHELNNPGLLGRFPSADIDLLRGPNGQNVGKMVGHPNGTNVGIETVFVLLHLSTHGVMAEFDDDAFGNTDMDTMSSNPTRSDKNDLLEIVDAWGNPFAYFSAMDYKKLKGLTSYKLGEKYGGEEVEVKPQKSEKTGMFFNSGTFQLISAGEDGEFGTPDDIKNW